MNHQNKQVFRWIDVLRERLRATKVDSQSFSSFAQFVLRLKKAEQLPDTAVMPVKHTKDAVSV